MRFAFVVIEEDAGRAVQLRDDYALRAVDHERAMIGHQRHFTEIDLLFPNVLDGLGRAAGILIVNNQTNQYADRRRVRQSAHLAFLDVENRLTESVADVFERCVTRIADDREHRLESRVQADVVAILDRLVRLQKLLVRVDLDRQQIRNVQNRRTLTEILADTFFLSE